jgi:DNA polymerase-3 subunit alpha
MKFCNVKLGAFKDDLVKYIGHKLNFGVIVSAVEHRVSKMGKGWATFIVEDYKDSHEFRIFGNEYLQFRHFLVVNSCLYVSAILQKGWINKDTGAESEPRLKFTNFMLLHDVMDDKCEKITIQLNMSEINAEYVKHLHSVLKEYEIAGKQKLEFAIRERKEKIDLTLPSRGMKLNVSTEFFERLDKENIRFKIN